MAVTLEFNAKFDDLFSGMRQTEAGLETLQQTSNETNKVISDGAKKATTEQDKFNKEIKETAINSAAAAKAVTNVANSEKQLASESQKTAATIKSSFGGIKSMLTEVATGIGLALGTQALIDFGRESIKTFAHFQSLTNAINFIQGSAEKGAEALDFLREISQRLGLDLQSTVEGFKSFSASAQLSGISAEETKRIFESVSVAVTGSGLSAEDANGVFLALSQVISKGTVAAEELRGQIGERLPGAFGLAAKSIGVTEQQLNKMLEQGQVVAKDFLPKFAETLKTTFQGALPEAINSTTANINRMNTAIFDTKLAFGELLAQGVFPKLMEAIEGVTVPFKELIADVKLLATQLGISTEGVDGFGISMGILGQIFKNLTYPLKALIFMIDLFVSGFQQAVAAVTGFSEATKTAFNGIKNFEFEGLGTKIADSFKKGYSDSLKSIPEVTKKAIKETEQITSDAVKKQLGLLEELRNKLKVLQADQEKNTDPKKVQKFINDIASIQSQIDALTGKAAEDAKKARLKSEDDLQKELLKLRKEFLANVSEAEKASLNEVQKIMFEHNKKLAELEESFFSLQKAQLKKGISLSPEDIAAALKARKDLYTALQKDLKEAGGNGLQLRTEMTIDVKPKFEPSEDTVSLWATFEDRLSQELENLAKGKGFSMANILFPDDSAEDRAIIDQKLAEIGQSILSATNSIFELQQQQIDQRENANEQHLSDLQERISATEAALNEELDLQKRGYANNVNAKQEELSKLKAEERKALEEKKRIAEEEQKLSRQKAIAANIEAGAQMALSVATLFAKGALTGPAGIISAIALSAAILAQFLAIKAQLQSTSLEEGGEIDFGMIKGNRHSQGGGERIGRTNIFVEGGEFVSRRSVAQDYGNLLHDMNKGRTSQKGNDELVQLLSERGIVMSGSEIKKYSQSKGELKSIEIGGRVESEKETKKLRGEFGEFTKKHFDKDEVVINSDGSKSVTKGSITTIYK